MVMTLLRVYLAQMIFTSYKSRTNTDVSVERNAYMCHETYQRDFINGDALSSKEQS